MIVPAKKGMSASESKHINSGHQSQLFRAVWITNDTRESQVLPVRSISAEFF